jgi:hypothetical protein
VISAAHANFERLTAAGAPAHRLDGAIGAAYTGASPARQRRFVAAVSRFLGIFRRFSPNLGRVSRRYPAAALPSRDAYKIVCPLRDRNFGDTFNAADKAEYRGLNIEAEYRGRGRCYRSISDLFGGGKRAAMTYFNRGLTSPLVRRIIGWLRRFG